MADVRVRLVFVDDVARHVQRRRGFSSCWYLVPSDVKLVGDLAHRCPKGLELRLEELPLLATQSIRVVRDNDTIRESSSSESEEEVIKTRKRKLHKKEKQEQPKKKNKNVKHVEKEVKDRPSATKKNSKGESSSSSSSSESDAAVEAPDLSKALASYPAVPVASSSFEPKDVIAFKTLTLCLETWQPVLSEWKCGQVQSVDASVNGESVDFCESPSDELYSVQTSEISELRFLSGPSYASLQQSAPAR
ncbi:Coilin, N-terminal domain [Phytophthora cactorum]|nr:Coilin, N-terminal domain [Phytophthora cactorum]